MREPSEQRKTRNNTGSAADHGKMLNQGRKMESASACSGHRRRGIFPPFGFFSCQTSPRVVYCAPQRQKRLSRQPHSVIGNTPDFGSVFLGSSPGGAANPTLLQGGFFVAFFQDSSSPGASLNAISPSSHRFLKSSNRPAAHGTCGGGGKCRKEGYSMSIAHTAFRDGKSSCVTGIFLHNPPAGMTENLYNLGLPGWERSVPAFMKRCAAITPFWKPGARFLSGSSASPCATWKSPEKPSFPGNC